MITVEEAKSILFNQEINTQIETIAYDKSLGFKLAENIIADRAMPPFDRVTMDGIAINFADYENGIRTWHVVKTQFAGEAAATISLQGECVEVMTGAVLPTGCNVIIRYEDLEKRLENQFQLIETTVKLGQNIHRTASDKRIGEILLKQGQLIGATDIALLATVGKLEVKVFSKLKIAIIATGNELTNIDTVPETFQIRASNHEMIAASLQDSGIKADKFLMRDHLEDIKALLSDCLNRYNIVVITGAVSKGKTDFIPEILVDLGVTKLFHGVAQRPGKPFLFGKKDACLVFAMPGNPVSVAVCTSVYLLPFIFKHNGAQTFKCKASVSHDIMFKPALTYFMQAKVTQNEDGKFNAIPYPGNGSGDLTNLSEINAFIVLPQNKESFSTKEFYEVYFTRKVIY